MELEQQVSAQQIVFKPKKLDSCRRDEETARAMDLPPRPGSRETFPGSGKLVALGGNRPQPPQINQIDENYAAAVAETFSEYPRVMYHKAYRKGPDGQAIPLRQADEKNPGYPIPADMAAQNGVLGITSGARDSQAIKEQFLYKTCFIPLGWDQSNPAPIDLALCKKQEADLMKSGWVRNPADLKLPAAQTIEELCNE
jgi:hypothetical protein